MKVLYCRQRGAFEKAVSTEVERRIKASRPVIDEDAERAEERISRKSLSRRQEAHRRAAQRAEADRIAKRERFIRNEARAEAAVIGAFIIEIGFIVGILAGWF